METPLGGLWGRWLWVNMLGTPWEDWLGPESLPPLLGCECWVQLTEPELGLLWALHCWGTHWVPSLVTHWVLQWGQQLRVLLWARASVPHS